MTLRRKQTKKGGCEYANISDNYNLLTDAIKQVKTTGGCRSYADVNSSYMLTETKGGKRKTKKGGDLLSVSNTLLKSTTDLINQQKGGCGCSKRGGAAELAPFAAAVALMGARFFIELNKENKTSSSSRRKSSSRKNA
jgi:hypothetical protein